MSVSARGVAGVGEVLNLMSNDVHKIGDWLWDAPVYACNGFAFLGSGSRHELSDRCAESLTRRDRSDVVLSRLAGAGGRCQLAPCRTRLGLPLPLACSPRCRDPIKQSTH